MKKTIFIFAFNFFIAGYLHAQVMPADSTDPTNNSAASRKNRVDTNGATESVKPRPSGDQKNGSAVQAGRGELHTKKPVARKSVHKTMSDSTKNEE